MAQIHKNRIKRILQALRKEDGALLLSSSPIALRNRDIAFPYRQNSDFYYLTGSKDRGFSLFLSPLEKHPYLYTEQADSKRLIWEGAGENPKTLANSLDAELLQGSKGLEALTKKIRGFRVLYHQNIPGTLSYEIASELLEILPHNRKNIPQCFELCDSLLTPMRLIKDQEEIAHIKRASAITSAALYEVSKYIEPGMPEAFIQATLDYWFKVHGGQNAFPSIVASGPNAAILHYADSKRLMKRGDLLLIDCGAEYEYYASDITRTLPVSGKFEGVYEDLYDAVLYAQNAAIRKVRPGIKAQVVYDAAARVLTQALIDLKVLKKPLSKRLKDKDFEPYFPHGIGHSLGLDTHDVGNLRGNNQAILQDGMVITIEPGIYFRRKVGKAPACGIRIEDDVLVTKKGAKLLTFFPKERGDIEELLSM